MIVSKEQIRELCNRITSDDNYKEIQGIVNKNCYSKAYLVGGRVYRTLIEIIHGCDAGSTKVDWDYYCVGKVVNNFIPSDWIQKRSTYNKKKNSLQLIRRKQKSSYHVGLGWGGGGGRKKKTSKHKKDKIDIIGIEDITSKRWASLGIASRRLIYFNAVPLDIQAIALDLENQHLYGRKAIEAIEKKTVKINNKNTLNENLSISWYLKEKSASLGFNSIEGSRNQDCNCFGGDIKLLWNKGCQFPKVHR